MDITMSPSSPSSPITILTKASMMEDVVRDLGIGELIEIQC